VDGAGLKSPGIHFATRWCGRILGTGLKKIDSMKKFALVLSMACLTAGSALAHGCWGFCGGPFLSIGIGPCLGFSVGCGPAYAWGCPASSYVCRQPYYPYYPAAVYDPVPVRVVAPASMPVYPLAPQVASTPTWVPSTPGAGRWVPDPAPYSYVPPTPRPAAARAATAGHPIVSILRSPEGIPVYFVSH
jgi:hypothetical protein